MKALLSEPVIYKNGKMQPALKDRFLEAPLDLRKTTLIFIDSRPIEHLGSYASKLYKVTLEPPKLEALQAYAIQEAQSIAQSLHYELTAQDYGVIRDLVLSYSLGSVEELLQQVRKAMALIITDAMSAHLKTKHEALRSR
jgi:hypothetical protein